MRTMDHTQFISKIFKLQENTKGTNSHSSNPTEFPKIQSSFTPQYPIKEGMEEVKGTIESLLNENITEPTQSFKYNSPIWPVKKPNGK